MGLPYTPAVYLLLLGLDFTSGDKLNFFGVPVVFGPNTAFLFLLPANAPIVPPANAYFTPLLTVGYDSNPSPTTAGSPPFFTSVVAIFLVP